MSEMQPPLVQRAFTRAALTPNHRKERRPWLSGIEQLRLDWDKLVLGHSTCLGPSLGHQGWRCGDSQETFSVGTKLWASNLS